MEVFGTMSQEKVQCENERVHGGDCGWTPACRGEDSERGLTVIGRKPHLPKA